MSHEANDTTTHTQAKCATGASRLPDGRMHVVGRPIGSGPTDSPLSSVMPTVSRPSAVAHASYTGQNTSTTDDTLHRQSGHSIGPVSLTLSPSAPYGQHMTAVTPLANGVNQTDNGIGRMPMAKETKTEATSTTPAEAGTAPVTSDRLFTQAEADAMVAAAVAAVKPAEAPKPVYSVIFSAPSSDKPDAVGMASITGVFPGRAVELSGIDLKLGKTGRMVVYMPGWNDKRGVRGAQEVLERPIRPTNGGPMITTQLSENGARDFGRFVDAIADAYKSLPAGDKYGRPVALDF